MAAGLGFKTFTTGEVLTAGDVNGYLMQGINVFASSAARASAITSPQEGQYSFLKDTNALEYYDGAAWVGAPVGDITAVTAGTGISGGGSSGDVTITNSMATAIDAKGDLVAGTGADAFSRVAVGANDTMLVGDSTAGTGLSYKSAATLYAYTTWTPTYTDFTLGNGTVSARYAQIGKLVHCQLRVILGSTSSVAGLITFTLPVTASTSVQGGYLGLNEAACLDSGTAQYPSRCALISSTQAVIFALAAGGTYLSTQSTSSTVPFTWAANDQFLVNFVYEAA